MWHAWHYWWITNHHQHLPCSQHNENAQGEGLRSGGNGCKHMATHPFPPEGMFLYTLTTTPYFLCSFLTPATTLPLSCLKRKLEGLSLVFHRLTLPLPHLKCKPEGLSLVFHHLTLPLSCLKHESEGPSLVSNCLLLKTQARGGGLVFHHHSTSHYPQFLVGISGNFQVISSNFLCFSGVFLI